MEVTKKENKWSFPKDSTEIFMEYQKNQDQYLISIMLF